MNAGVTHAVCTKPGCGHTVPVHPTDVAETYAVWEGECANCGEAYHFLLQLGAGAPADVPAAEPKRRGK